MLLLRRGFPLAALAAVAVGAGAFFLLRLADPIYAAQATVLMSSHDPNQRDFGTTLVTAPPLDVAAYRAAIVSRSVVGTALAALGEGAASEAELGRQLGALSVRSEGTSSSSILRIQVRDGEPARARALANAVAQAAVAWDQQRATQSLESIIGSLEAQIASVEQELAVASAHDPVDSAAAAGLERNRAELGLQLSSARALRSGAVGRLELLEEAATPGRPVSPRPLPYAAAAAVGAAILVYLLMLLRSALDTRVRSLDDLRQVSGLPLIAEFPKVAGGRRQLPREAASYLRTAIGFATQALRTKVLLVTSTGPGHGKSSVAIGLAESLARQRYRVLLLDADLRKPVIGAEYRLDPGSSASMEKALQRSQGVSPTRIDLQDGVSLDVLPGFAPAVNPTEQLEAGFGALLARLGAHYDYVVVDSAPVLPVADTLVIAPQVSAVVFTVSLPDARRSQVANALELLRRLDANLVGVVATNLDRRWLHAAEGYGYGYGYGASEGEGQRWRQRRLVTPPASQVQRQAQAPEIHAFVSAAPTSEPASPVDDPGTPVELFDSSEFPPLSTSGARWPGPS